MKFGSYFGIRELYEFFWEGGSKGWHVLMECNTLLYLATDSLEGRVNWTKIDGVGEW